MLILAIRLAAELVGLVALGYWGASTQTELPARIGLWLVAPAALAIVWAIVVAPTARNRLPLAARGLIGTGLLLIAAGALVLAGQPWWAMAFAGVVVVDEALILALDPRPAVGRRPAIARH